MDAITPTKGPQPVMQAAKRELPSDAKGKNARSDEQAAGVETEPVKDPLKHAERVLNDVLQDSRPPNSRLTIEIDEPTGRFVYKAVNNDSGETIRQYPQEEFLRLLARFREIEGLSISRSA